MTELATHHRFKSWEHCNNFFVKHKGNLADENLFDNACLQLGFYLASWGMMRGSTFLLQKDYRIHKYFIKNVAMNFKYKKYYSSMQELPIAEEDIGGLNTLIEDTIKAYVDNIKEINGIVTTVSVTDTLASKILLGVYGIVPAYDTYFVNAMKSHGFKNTNFCEDSIKDLISFYNEFEDEFEESRMLFKEDGVNYPPMKLIDMYFWQVGYMLANPNKFLEDELQGICEFVRQYSQKINAVIKFKSREKLVSLSKNKYRTLGLKEEISRDINNLLANSKEKGILDLETSSAEIYKAINFNTKIHLPIVFRQRNIFVKVIPTVCNLKNMLNKLEENNWELEKLKPWEKRSYEAYKIDNVINKIIESKKNEWPSIIKDNILNLFGDDIGTSCIDIYLVGFVSEKYGTGNEHMFNLVKDKLISEKLNSANAIYTVAKGVSKYKDKKNKLNDNKEEKGIKQKVAKKSPKSNAKPILHLFMLPFKILALPIIAILSVIILLLQIINIISWIATKLLIVGSISVGAIHLYQVNLGQAINYNILILAASVLVASFFLPYILNFVLKVLKTLNDALKSFVF